MPRPEITSGDYEYLPIEKIHFGTGSIKHLATELDRKHSKKPFIITGNTIAKKTDLAKKVERASGRKLAGVFSEIKQHAPSTSIGAAVAAVREAGADCIISLGGGSPIDSTKIVVKQLSHDFQETPIPHISIPTTLSAAEFSHVAGMTDEKANRKIGFRDMRMVPQIIFLDPEVTGDTPKWLWASTGIRSLDHAVEAIYSPKHQLYVDTLALQAINLLFNNLKQSSEDTKAMHKRLACQTAAWMSFAGVVSVGTGLSHAIGRVIGATWNIPHGITSCITLAEVMRSQAKRNPDRLALIAAAQGIDISKMNVDNAAMLAADGVSKLVTELGLSKHLRDYGIKSSDLPNIAREVASPEEQSAVMQVLQNVF